MRGCEESRGYPHSGPPLPPVLKKAAEGTWTTSGRSVALANRVRGARPGRRAEVRAPGADLCARVWLDLETGDRDPHRPSGEGVQRA